MRNLENIKRIVIKIGSSTLTHENGFLNITRIEKIVRYISALHNRGYEVVLVSSGAIGAGMGKLNLEERPKTIPEKQALAAIGQVALIHLYQKFFSEYAKNVGQILLTMDVMSKRERYLNARNTFLTLLKVGAIPVVNENDAVVVDEIKVGDNDTLSAYVASLIDADLLILLSDIDGLYNDNPRKNKDAKLIKYVEKLDDDIKDMAKGAGSKFGTGGMATKIEAAKIVTESGSDMIIASGDDPENIIKIIDGEEIGTYFKTGDKKVGHKKHWIKYNSKKSGAVYIDNGAVKALNKHKSLLPIGIKEIKGSFKKGSSVKIFSLEGKEVAAGLVNYTSKELELIKGKNTEEIEDILGYKDYDEAVHIDNMYVKEEE